LTYKTILRREYIPKILEPRRRIDQTLYEVFIKAWVKGISTRKGEALVAAIGWQAGISARR